MKIKLLSAAAVLATGFVAAPAFADDAPTPEFTVTGTAAVVSNYKFRGLTQSDNRPAVQASITLSHKSGFYVAMWGSSGANSKVSGVNATYNYLSPNEGTEIDVYGGYTKSFSGVTFDGGVYGYIYPSATANNLFEVYASLAKSVGPITGKVGLNWAPKQHYFTQYCAGGVCPITQYNMYEYGELSYATGPFTLHTHLGHTGGGLNFVKEYIDYTFGVSYKWKSLTFDVSGVGTNISKSDSAGAAVAPVTPNEIYRYGKLVPVVSLTASF